MPESVRDRCTKAHEYIFLLSKSRRYYFDAAAIREPLAQTSIARLSQDIGKQNGSNRVPGKTNGPMKAVGKSGNKERKPGSARGCPEGTGSNVCGSVPWEDDTRNKRSVWTVSTKPFKDAHFATFPEDLIMPCIMAGTSAQGCCAVCGAPLARLTETQYKKHENWYGDKQEVRNSRGKAGTAYNEPIARTTTGWKPTCKCYDGKPVPCTVLDPFAGAGTTGVVVARGYRNFIGFEINPEYCEMARKRIEAITRQGRLFESAT